MCQGLTPIQKVYAAPGGGQGCSGALYRLKRFLSTIPLRWAAYQTTHRTDAVRGGVGRAGSALLNILPAPVRSVVFRMIGRANPADIGQIVKQAIDNGSAKVLNLADLTLQSQIAKQIPAVIIDQYVTDLLAVSPELGEGDAVGNLVRHIEATEVYLALFEKSTPERQAEFVSALRPDLERHLTATLERLGRATINVSGQPASPPVLDENAPVQAPLEDVMKTDNSPRETVINMWKNLFGEGELSVFITSSNGACTG